MMCLFAMMAAGSGLKAQEITITLDPGWNWIGYPNAEPMAIASALGDFVPMEGDMIYSQDAATKYQNGVWRGRLGQFIPGKGYHYYSNRTEEVSFVFASTAPQVTVTTSEPTDITATSAVVGGTVDAPEGTHVFQYGVCWGTEPSPDIDGNHTSDGTGIGSFSSTLEGLTTGLTYYVRAYVVTDNGLAYGNEVSFTTLGGGSGNDHEYVDLGLSSGTLWATCNVGADNPEEYGDYFAWGEIQPKDTYDWSTYQHCMGGYDMLTKYCTDPNYGYEGFSDNLTTLLPEDDAATANWGSDWRMPTQAEWQELLNNTTVTWAQQNGVNGRLFTAANGNSLFLPAAGYRLEDELNSVGDFGYYWSSSLYTNCPYGAWLFFGSSDDEIFFYYRTYGKSVRAVRSSSQSNVPTGAIDGKFTINADGDQVYFSQGNLQYIGSANTPYWKFADNQWDVLGTTTGQNSSDQNVDRDLFGWGTSGYNHGANCYQPWSTSTSYSDYYAYGSYTYNLYDQTGQADWGYNPISNGGNQANQWRTLTTNEWVYVFNSRTTSSGIRYAKAKVNNVNGVILLPDDWSTSYYTLGNTNSTGASFSSNTISATQWSTLEQYGAVFLPATGDRDGTYDVGGYGYYWSASYLDSNYVYFVNFGDSYLYPQDDFGGRSFGFCVRLARVAE